MKKFVCTICGYVHEGDTPPEFCPQCKAPASKFEEQKTDGLTWADEHRIGVAAGVDAEIIAVSYTHLDVYKRQRPERSLPPRMPPRRPPLS